MGVAYYPTLEKDIPGFQPALAIDGKALSRAIDQLDALATRLDVPPLTSFYSESAAETFEMIGEEPPEDIADEPAVWFDPAEGLRTVAALLAHLQAHPDALAGAPNVIIDLEGLRTVLTKAREHGTRFRLRIDI